MAARYFRSATSAGTYESMIGSDFCFQNPEDRDARIRVCRAELRCTGWHSGSCLLCLLAVAAHTHHKRAVVHQEIGRCPIGAAVTNALNLFLFYAGQCAVFPLVCVHHMCLAKTESTRIPMALQLGIPPQLERPTKPPRSVGRVSD